MLTLAQMEKLRAAYRAHLPEAEADVLAEIGHPTPDTIIDTALAGLKSPDRNVRVLMLRVLNGQSSADAVQGLLLGLQDGQRRVKEVAIKSCLPFLDYPQIANRIKEIILDEQEHRKIRQAALHCLTGHGVNQLRSDLPEAAVTALKALMDQGVERDRLLFRLLFLELTASVRQLLQDFADNGSEAEATQATKALNGYRVIHIAAFEGNKRLIKQVEQQCERAAGRTFYWIERDAFAELGDAYHEGLAQA